MADDPDEYRRKAERLLQQASEATNMRERGRLIDEAMHWHMLAMDAHDHHDNRTNDNEDDDDAWASA